MTTELRETGISVVGDIPWGTHFCYFYETKQDLLDILIPYFKVGLENNEFCLWIISNSELLTMQEATSALRKALPDLDRYLAEGSIEVVAHDEWFLDGGDFDVHRVANRFKVKLDEALARGYAGMRVNGSPAWLQKKDGRELRQFEEEVDRLFPNERIIASCTYPLGGSGADFLLDVARNHQFAIARRHGNWDVLETPELIEAKREIKRLNEELEQRVIERTEELAATNEELRREISERKRAEEQLRATSEQLRALSASLQSAREEEGTRIAREIHDELGGALTRLRWELEKFDKVISESGEGPRLQALRGMIEEMLSLIDTTVNAVRRITSELRPSVLDDLGLVEAVEWQAQQFQAQTGIVCRCVYSLENVDLNQEQSTAVFRIFQETLTNVLRHAQATRVDITMTEEDGEFVLTIRDNGRGITEDERSGSQSLGLLGMRERAHLIGGKIDIDGIQGQGTVITLRVPISGERPEAVR